MSIKLSDIPKHTAMFQKVLGLKLVNFIRDRVRNRHLNYKLQNFKPYEASYRDLKVKRKAAPAGDSQWSNSAVPDMTLTGKTMSDLGVFESDLTARGFTFGWIAIYGDIVEKLFLRKNYQIVNLRGFPLSKEEDKLIFDALDGDYDLKRKKYEKDDINLNIKF